MSRVAFTIGERPIYWYGIIIAVALVVGVLIGISEAKRKGYRSELVLDLILLAVPVCIIFARIFYVIFEWDNYAADPISMLYIWNGGLAIYGGVIGGVIAAVIFYFLRRVEVGELMDIAAPGLIIGQAIGRWGNFTNQEAFGYAVTNPNLQWFPFAVHIDKPVIDGVSYAAGYFHATFFYESMWSLIVFAILMMVRKKIKVRGGLFALYVVLYGCGRFWIEQLRTDSLMWGSLRVSEGLSELLIVGGIAYLLYMYFAKKEFFPYTGYYEIGLSEEQVNGLKGKRALLNAQYDLKKAQWLADIIRDNSGTTPRYRAVKEKAEIMKEKAAALQEKLGEKDAKVKSAQSKANALEAKAEKIYAQIKLEGRLKLAEAEAEKTNALAASLKESDPDSEKYLAAQEKAESNMLLVEKIRDSMESEALDREALLEKAETRIEELKEKVKDEEEKYNNKQKKRGKSDQETDEKPAEDGNKPKQKDVKYKKETDKDDQ